MKRSGLKNISLRSRIFISFFSILLLMACSCFFIISRFITRFTQTQLNNDYDSILSETCDVMENLLWNLTLTSAQILDNEEIQETLMLYQESISPYEQQIHYSSLLDSITMLTLANTDISLLYLYDNTLQDFIFSSFPLSRRQTEQAPVLYQNASFSFYGPCQSQSSYNGNPVLILKRTETLPSGKSVVLSIESGFYSLLAPIRSAGRKSAFLAITNASGELVYTTFEDESDIEIMNLPNENQGGGSEASSSILMFHKDYRSMSKAMSQGWNVHIIIPEHIYIKDYYQSLTDIFACVFILAAFVALIALYFWKSIYSPLRLFDQQLELLLSDESRHAQIHSSIPEYDYLLNKIMVMQKQIQEMIRRIVQQEKTNTKMQIEKLRAQINPHFLLNTLNTVHWMALMNGQDDIDRITQSLSHLLSYNLDKESVSTNLDKELNALAEYVQLQKVRYDFHFRVERPVSNDLNYPCPKFLLQPIIENALAHGYQPGMEILVQIRVDASIHLTLSDTGTGMDSQTLARVKSFSSPSTPQSEQPPSDAGENTPVFGIGLAYVVNSLRAFFSDDFHFIIESSENHGTVVTIDFPKLKGYGYHVKNTDR